MYIDINNTTINTCSNIGCYSKETFDETLAGAVGSFISQLDMLWYISIFGLVLSLLYLFDKRDGYNQVVGAVQSGIAIGMFFAFLYLRNYI